MLSLEKDKTVYHVTNPWLVLIYIISNVNQCKRCSLAPHLSLQFKKSIVGLLLYRSDSYPQVALLLHLPHTPAVELVLQGRAEQTEDDDVQ